MAHSLILPTDSATALMNRWRDDLTAYAAERDVAALRREHVSHALNAVKLLVKGSDTAARVFAHLADYAGDLIEELEGAPRVLRRPATVTEQLAERDL
jgi:hypothetical protein